jgi:DNA polymerase-3 subunit alpha
VRFNQAAKRMRSANQNSLFGGGMQLAQMKFINGGEPTDKKMMLIWEKELLGLYITDHPFNIYASKVKKQTVPIKKIAEATEQSNGKSLLLAGIITGIQRILTKRGDPMLFVNLEDTSGSTEILVFSDVLNKNPNVWQENKAIMVMGRLSFRDGVPKVIANAVKEL